MNELYCLYSKGWIKAKDFTDKYNLDRNAPYILRKDNKYVEKHSCGVMINEKALIRRRNFNHRVWLEACDNYYILTEYITDNQLGSLIAKYIGASKHSWSVYAGNALFSMAFMDRSLLSYQINTTLWNFWRFTSILIKGLKKKDWKLHKCNRLKPKIQSSLRVYNYSYKDKRFEGR